MPDRATRASTQVVWLNDGWKRWMTWREPAQPPVPEAALEPHSIPGAICADLAVDLAQVPEAAVLAMATAGAASPGSAAARAGTARATGPPWSPRARRRSAAT